MRDQIKFRNSVRNLIGRLCGAQNDMDVLWATNLPIIYVNNPKCGCSTMKRSLRKAQAALPHLRDRHVVENPHQSDELLTPNGLPPKASQEMFVISCVRNPYTRALSGYLDKIHGLAFDDYRVMHKRPVSDFEDHLTALLGYNPRKMEPHFRPQHHNLNYPAVRFDALFYLERLAHFQNFLKRFSPGGTVDTFKPHATAAGSKLEQYYTPRAIDLVRCIYREDFELFGYDQDLENTANLPGDVLVDDIPVAGVGETFDGLLEQPLPRTRFNPLARTLFCHRLAEMKII